MTQITSIFNNLINIANDEDDDDDICPLSGEHLCEPIITLQCNHKFNYIPLYNEIERQKCTRNRYEVTVLYKHQLKCPYCRNIQNKLLPNIPHPSVKNIVGVNFPNKLCMYLTKCKYVFKSGARRDKECGRECNMKYCSQHSKNDTLCCSILKSGKRKGEKCGSKCKTGLVCARHSIK
jgi:hypothetical protein